MSRPQIRTTKKMRRLNSLNKSTLIRALSYCELAQSVFEWDRPEELKELEPGYEETLAFFNGFLGIKKHRGKLYFVSGYAMKLTYDGRPLTWFPGSIYGEFAETSSLLRETDASKNPCIQFNAGYDKCVQYIETEESAHISMRQNIIRMRTPIMIKGWEGKNQIQHVFNMVEGGEALIPAIDESTGTNPIDTLDLGAQNFIDPLTGAIDASFGWTLAELGIPFIGTQKASGITEEEANSMKIVCALRQKTGLEYRKYFCDLCKDVLNLDMGVRVNGQLEEHIRDVVENTMGLGVPNDKMEDEENGNKK